MTVFTVMCIKGKKNIVPERSARFCVQNKVAAVCQKRLFKLSTCFYAGSYLPGGFDTSTIVYSAF